MRVPTIKCESCLASLPAPIVFRTGLSYHCCNVCGHCIKVSERGLDHDFEQAQAQYFAEGGLLSSQVPVAFDREVLEQRRQWTQRVIPAKSRIVEVGPGSGFLAALLKEQGHQIELIEHSPVLATHLRARLGVTVHNGVFETIDCVASDADAFCSFHVIEHVPNPLAHLRRGLKAVRPGGVGLVATPNAASWEQRIFRRLSPNFDSAHLRVFSEDSLKRCCREAGWMVETALTPEYTGGWLRVVSKAIRKLKSEDEEATAGKYATPSVALEMIYATAAAIGWPVRKIQAGLGGGNEVFLVLRRPLETDLGMTSA